MQAIQNAIDYHNNRFLMFILDGMAYDFERKGNKVIRLTLGKSELPLHLDILKVMQNSLLDFKKSSLVFPGGLPELKKRLSNHYLDQYGIRVNQKNIIISTGTSTIFRNLFHLLLSNKTDEVLLPLPYYSLYKFSALLTGAKIKFYKINLSNMSVDLNSFSENFSDNTKVVVINSPGNPLGNILSAQELYSIDSIVNGKAFIINDEVYANICFDKQCSLVTQLINPKSTFITTNSFSKGYRMYSRRVGYCLVPDELVEPMTVIQHHTLLTTDPVSQYGALAALDYQSEVQELVALYRDRRNYVREKFNNIKFVEVLPSEGSFYIVLNCNDYIHKNKINGDFDLAKRILRKEKVAVVPGSDFGLPNMLRLSFSASEFKTAVDRMVNFFGK